MRNLSKYDRIFVKIDDIPFFANQLDIIKEMNPNVEYEDNISIEEGVLAVPIEESPLAKNSFIYFSIASNVFNFEVYIDEFESPFMEFSFNPFTTDVELRGDFYEKNKENREQMKELARRYTYWVTISALYITHCRELGGVDMVEEKIRVSKKQRYKSKSKTSKFTYITRKKYTVRPLTEEQKRTITRHTESWEVRGHYRKCPSGKVVWVKPHKKGSGEVTQKNYKLTK
jgi:hypothetical protein